MILDIGPKDIHTRWKSQTGKGRDEMSVADLKEKETWINPC